MYNHIGHFADGSEALAKALFFGGVTRRFPSLRVGLLEGGADWGAHVYTHLVDRWEKRNRDGGAQLRPGRDRRRAARARCSSDTAPTSCKGRSSATSRRCSRDSLGVSALPHGRAARANGDRRLRAGRHRERRGHPRPLGRQLLLRLRGRRPHRGRRLQRQGQPAGRQDQRDLVVRRRATGTCPTLTEPLAETWDLVEQGVITAADFKALVFDNPHRFYTEANPRFFEGTAIGSAAEEGRSRRAGRCGMTSGRDGPTARAVGPHAGSTSS